MRYRNIDFEKIEKLVRREEKKAGLRTNAEKQAQTITMLEMLTACAENPNAIDATIVVKALKANGAGWWECEKLIQQAIRKGFFLWDHPRIGVDGTSDHCYKLTEKGLAQLEEFQSFKRSKEARELANALLEEIGRAS